MDGDNRRRAAQEQAAQIPGQVMGGVAAAAEGTEGSDWRNHLQTVSRQRIVNKITESLKRHLPFSGQEELQQLKKIAVRFEERVYTGATSRSDYLRKISLKMLAMEIKSPNSMANSRQSSNAARNSIKKPQEPASQSIQNHAQQLPTTTVSNQSQMHMHEVIPKLQQDRSLKESKIEELKSKNASLEIRVSDLQARAEKDEEKYKEMTHLMSELQKTVEELHKTVKELQKNA